MRPAILQLDDAIVSQSRLQARLGERGDVLDARDIGRSIRLWGKPEALNALAVRLDAAWPDNDPRAVFAGSGDFHHVTPILLARALRQATGPVTLVHFDNHPDWMRCPWGAHCGAWVAAAAALPGVAQVLTIGVNSRDIEAGRAKHRDPSITMDGRIGLFAWRAPDGSSAVQLGETTWPTIDSLGEATFLDRLDETLTSREIYVTIDKDMLSANEAATNWDQGQASLVFLLAALRRVCAGRRLIGADVVGDWSAPAYGGGPLAALMKRGEALADQPWRRPSAAAISLNESANLRLLDVFEGLAG